MSGGRKGGAKPTDAGVKKAAEAKAAKAAKEKEQRATESARAKEADDTVKEKALEKRGKTAPKDAEKTAPEMCDLTMNDDDDITETTDEAPAEALEGPQSETECMEERGRNRDAAIAERNKAWNEGAAKRLAESSEPTGGEQSAQPEMQEQEINTLKVSSLEVGEEPERSMSEQPVMTGRAPTDPLVATHESSPLKPVTRGAVKKLAGAPRAEDPVTPSHGPEASNNPIQGTQKGEQPTGTDGAELAQVQAKLEVALGEVKQAQDACMEIQEKNKDTDLTLEVALAAHVRAADEVIKLKQELEESKATVTSLGEEIYPGPGGPGGLLGSGNTTS